MATVLEAPPQPKRGLGCCLGKGCLILVILFFLLVFAFAVGGYLGVRHTFTGTKPRQLPQVPVSESEQQAVLQRWDDFQNAVHSPTAAPPDTSATNLPGQPQNVAAPPEKPRIEFTANDINQLIAANRRSRGKAFVSIANNVGHVQVSIPLSGVGFAGRHLNADFDVRSSPDGDPRKVEITTTSLRGVQVPERVLNALLGFRTLRGYLDGYINTYGTEYGVSKLQIANGRVLLEAAPAR